MIVYCVRNLITGKQYIGQTVCSLYKRWHDHCCTGSYLHNAIKKYGKEHFIVEKIDEAQTQEELDRKEREWIIKLNTKAPYGYNLRDGGGRGALHETTKDKLSINRNFVVHSKRGDFIGQWHNMAACAKDLNIRASKIWACLHDRRKSTNKYIFCFTDHIEQLPIKIRLANTHMHPPHSLATKQKLSNNHWSKRGFSSPNKGRHYRLKQHVNWKLFQVFREDTGELVGSWPCIIHCAEELRLNAGNIGACLHGVRKHTKGYIFKYSNPQYNEE